MPFFRWLGQLLVVLVPFGLLSKHKPRHYREMLRVSQHLRVVSGRTSFEIVQKASAAGAPWVLASSAPSSLAVELAERFRVLLVCFARGASFTVYAGKFRLAGEA